VREFDPLLFELLQGFNEDLFQHWKFGMTNGWEEMVESVMSEGDEDEEQVLEQGFFSVSGCIYLAESKIRINTCLISIMENIWMVMLTILTNFKEYK